MPSTTKEATASYIELSGQAYSLFVDALAATNQRRLDYTKSVWEILSRPYASAAPEAAVRENFERASQIAGLTVSELKSSGEQARELTESVISHAAKVQETYVHTARGVVNTGISNVNYAKDATSQQFDDLSKRLDEIQTRIATPVSSTN
jgi:hypothetical protein